MKTSRLLALAAALMSGVAGPALAQTVTGSKDVTLSVNFNAKCQLASGASSSALTIDFGTFNAFTTGNVSPTASSVTLECTRGLGATPSMNWDALAGTSNTSGAFGGGQAVSQGILAGLRYTLTATPATVVPGDIPVLSGTLTNGTPTTYPFTISGTLYQGPGEGPSGAQSALRTLTVAF